MTQPAPLRPAAEALAATLPPLLADAEHLAETVMLGMHGRRRAGAGDEFWQYRPMVQGDELRAIDWRRSARSDQHFIREHEWQAAQSVVIWADCSQSMDYRGAPHRPAKSDRARLLALALAVLLVRAGERVGLAQMASAPRGGRLQLLRMAEVLERAPEPADYGLPQVPGLPHHARALFVSDFLGDPAGVQTAMARAADRGVRGVLMQILDPDEESFPFDGRTIFQSMGGTLRHETRQADDLRARYQARLAERRDLLAGLARSAGWLFQVHHTDSPAQAALLWLHAALERRH